MKMKASELRIGNWVKTLEDGSTHFRQVTGIEIASENQRIDGFTRPFVRCGHMAAILNDEDIEYISPIPLTPEILEKAGFVTIGRYAIGVGGYNVFAKGRIELLQPNEGDPYILAFYEAKITHLHQLQNLYFALTGQELTINL